MRALVSERGAGAYHASTGSFIRFPLAGLVRKVEWPRFESGRRLPQRPISTAIPNGV